jgi:REP element-mobilizing transposase RayT
VPIGDDTFSYRRCLPHLSKTGKTYFVTFATRDRLVLPPPGRDVALAACIHDHARLHWLQIAVVMPDHVHLLTTPFAETTLHDVLRRLKVVSAHRINKLIGRSGPLWQRESFDHILRNSESHQQKAGYLEQSGESWPRRKTGRLPVGLACEFIKHFLHSRLRNRPPHYAPLHPTLGRLAASARASQ